MRSLLIKIFWETRWPVLLFGLGLAIAMGLLTALLPRVLGDIHLVFEKLPFVKPLITALLGVDPGKQLSAAMSQAFLWVHPTVLSLIWAHEVMYCTRVPAGEVDRGTVDFLLGLPISRWELYVAETIGWLISGLFILGCGFFGHWIVELFAGTEMRPSWSSTIFVMINLFSVYIAVGSFSFLVSAVSDRRNRAIGVVFAVMLFSFLINFLAQFWDPLSGLPKSMKTPSQPSIVQFIVPASIVPASNDRNVGDTSDPNTSSSNASRTERAAAEAANPSSIGWSIASLSVMHYYRPATIIQSGKFPTVDVCILLSGGLLGWLAAGYYFSRRSICTV